LWNCFLSKRKRASAFRFHCKHLTESDHPVLPDAAKDPARLTNSAEVMSLSKKDEYVPEDLFLPGTLYYLQKEVENVDIDDESYTLWRGDPGENFQRILLSGNLISDHRCESIRYALRDVLKSLLTTEE
jgi:hypothetical protein